MSERLQAHPIFPTMIWSVELVLDEYEPINQGIMAKIDALLAPLPEIPPGETRQTSPAFHDLKEFEPLDPHVRSAATRIFSDLDIEYESFAITGCWANINPTGSGHMAHCHPNNFLSGIYYVKTQPGANRVTFHDPRPLRAISPKVRRNTPLNADKATLTVHDGLFLFFPVVAHPLRRRQHQRRDPGQRQLQHHVPGVRADHERAPLAGAHPALTWGRGRRSFRDGGRGRTGS